MKRSPMKRKSPMRKRGETPADALWRDARNATLERDEYACQGNDRGLDHACPEWHMGLHVHHVLRRSQGGADHPSNLITLCHVAHLWVHDHPAEAMRSGLLQRSGDTECVCGHVSRLHAVSSGQCTWGPGLSYGHGCPCAEFREAAA